MDKTRLFTERLVIRRFVRADYKALYAYLSLPEIVRFEPYEVFSLRDCKREAAKRARHPSFWALCLRGTDELIGNLYFSLQDPDTYRTWELGYVLRPDCQGMGYAAEGASRLLEYAFAVLRAHRVIARCNPVNTRSWKLMERLGMRREQHSLKSAWFKKDDNGDPIWHDTYLYAILREEWNNRATHEGPN
jgi:RimJ/RimL family protein N-acetyltransferase